MDFVVVGGVGAALQGTPVTTFDLDLVHSRRPQNVSRLLSALQALDAYYLEHPSKRLTPSAADLIGPAHHLFTTRAAPLDLLGVAVGARGYEDLLTHTVQIQLAPANDIHVLDLPTLILLKEELGR